ncbi:DUF817 domain-containing protein [Alkalicoccus urumqiensis]|uniref:DUF817 domain-containing protein n=1 Tax=Alkalicoccus urumqiensis TaxID=1548213 RepID=A0A2P6MJ98_ALKUR|nr:DUF817 domain-containing protein [Alkalicoccus urumqiensis]PRO66333.1 DUF817 domain-containing protein [Alkalicoccus urumqiensis]
MKHKLQSAVAYPKHPVRVSRPPHALVQFWHFGWQQALSCIFPVIIFAGLALTQLVDLPLLARYDWLLLFFLTAQIVLVKTGIETADEGKVILLFHVLGLSLELFKVQMGSWSYPEEAWTKIAGVPLYSGFMYASVAAYLCQAWRRLGISLIRWPRTYIVLPLTAAVYANFFTHHYITDLRWVLTGLVVLLFFRASVRFQVNGRVYRMPMLLSFVLIGFFVWTAENIATYFQAWAYPYQTERWTVVDLGKLSSWMLLVIVSFFLTASLKRLKENG